MPQDLCGIGALIILGGPMNVYEVDKYPANSPLCKNQAFRLGDNAYGLQFHIEITDRDIVNWAREYRESWSKAQGWLREYYRMEEGFKRSSSAISANFERLITASS